MHTPSAPSRRRAATIVHAILVVGAAVTLSLWAALDVAIGIDSAVAEIVAGTGLAMLPVVGLIFLLMRAIRQRADAEAQLAEEREKFAAAHREFAADAARRSEVEARLRVVQTTLKDAVDSLSEALVIYDPDDRVVLHNEAFALLYPETAALMIPGTPYIDCIRAIARSGRVADAIGRQEEWVAQRLQSHQAATGAIEHKLADGRRVMTRERRMRNGGIATLRIDITQLRRAEGRQRELEERLHHAQKLEAIGTLAAGIAHDLNNALMPVVALSQMVLTTLPADSSEREDIEIIAAGGRRAQALVQRLVSFSRKQQMVGAPVDLVRVVRHAVEMLRPSLPASTRLSPEIEAVPRIHADADQLQQVIVDLVSNAAHAIGEEKGTITVGLETERQPMAGGHGEEFIRLSVADTGCGMDPQTIARIFEPFFTTKDVDEGSGLGLALVHGIVTRHHGTIRVRSTPGQGTEFVVLLPVADAAATSDAAT